MERIKTNEIQSFETKHINIVRTFGAECTLLLERDGMFPLVSAEKIALFGNGARRTIKGGTGSGDVNVRHFVTIEEGLKNAGFEITTTAWMDRYDELYDQAKRSFFYAA